MYIACQQFYHMPLSDVHSTPSALVSSSSSFELLCWYKVILLVQNQRVNCGLFSQVYCHTFISLQHIYYIINLLKSSLPSWSMHYITVIACLYCGEFLWTECIILIWIETEIDCVCFLHDDRKRKFTLLRICKHCFMVHSVLPSLRNL
jgi:hypothetical protein